MQEMTNALRFSMIISSLGILSKCRMFCTLGIFLMVHDMRMSLAERSVHNAVLFLIVHL